MRTLVFSNPPFDSAKTKGWDIIKDFRSKGRKVQDPNGSSYKIGMKITQKATDLESVSCKFLSAVSLGIFPYYCKIVQDICLEGKKTVHVAIPAYAYDLAVQAKKIKSLLLGAAIGGVITTAFRSGLRSQGLAIALIQGAALGLILGIMLVGLQAMRFFQQQASALKKA